jgi:hypothetical protein
MMSWSHLIGQFGGLFKLFPARIHAASKKTGADIRGWGKPQALLATASSP